MRANYEASLGNITSTIRRGGIGQVLKTLGINKAEPSVHVSVYRIVDQLASGYGYVYLVDTSVCSRSRPTTCRPTPPILCIDRNEVFWVERRFTPGRVCTAR